MMAHNYIEVNGQRVWLERSDLSRGLLRAVGSSAQCNGCGKDIIEVGDLLSRYPSKVRCECGVHYDVRVSAKGVLY